MLGLMLVRPFLAEKSLIIVDDTNWQTVKQANWDFLAVEPRCKLLLNLETPQNGHDSFWNGIQVFSWDINQEMNYSWVEFTSTFRNEDVIEAIYNLHFQFDFQNSK